MIANPLLLFQLVLIDASEVIYTIEIASTVPF